MIEPELEYVFEIRATIAPEYHIGRSTDEALTFTPVVGGSVGGPRFTGTVLTGGGDWAVSRFGTAQLEARYLIQAEDGTVIDVLNRGYWRPTNRGIEHMDAGRDIPEEDAYFRTAPVFQTDAPAHRWLAEHQFVGYARDEGDQVCIRIFLVR